MKRERGIKRVREREREGGEREGERVGNERHTNRYRGRDRLKEIDRNERYSHAGNYRQEEKQR